MVWRSFREPDRTINVFLRTMTTFEVRGAETFVEATYQYQVTPWWQLHPDIQYVFNPGGGVLNQNASGQTIRNEVVLGIRTNVLF